MTDKIKVKKPPKKVDGIPVVAHEDNPMEIRGGIWITLVPKDDNVDALWEFDLLSGKILKTR
jgi:hypothetical protein